MKEQLMSEMKPRAVESTSMTPRQSALAERDDYIYAEPNVSYDQHLVTYEYTQFRGEIQPRTIGAVQMKGR